MLSGIFNVPAHQAQATPTMPAAHLPPLELTGRYGNLVHRTREDDASGQARVVSKSFGKPIQLHSPHTVLAAVRSVQAPDPCQLFVSVIKNPYAGFRQNEAKLLRKRVTADNLSLAATWLAANSITLIGSEAALTELHNALSQNPDKPQS